MFARLSRSSRMPTMINLKSVLTQLELEHRRLTSQIEAVGRAISMLGGESGTTKMSAAGRARIAAAQRARWARIKGNTGKVASISSRKKRTLSPAAIARIRAAQRKRWAKWRKQKKA